MPFSPKDKVNYENLKLLFDECGGKPTRLVQMCSEWLVANAPKPKKLVKVAESKKERKKKASGNGDSGDGNEAA